MLLTALCLLALPQEPELPPTPEGFAYEPERLVVERVYHYRKSNLDGSNPSHVDLYVASEDRIESFKYHEGQSQGSLVVAGMDWDTCSVRTFLTTRVAADGSQQEVARLADQDGVLHCRAPGVTFEVPVEFVPWHSYDFDLASLNLSLRFLLEPEGVVEVGIMDFHRGSFRFKGLVELEYLDDEERGGVDCRHYRIDGPGLEDRGGELWVRKTDDPMIVDYEIDLPDEDSMTSGKMVLLGSEPMTGDEWQVHRRRALGG